jgi:hypothetical protein
MQKMAPIGEDGLIPPDVRRWAERMLSGLSEENRSLVASCAASMIVGLLGEEAPFDLLEDVDLLSHTIRATDGSARYLPPILWDLLLGLGDGNWHIAARLVIVAGLRRSASIRENINRLRQALRGTAYYVEARRSLGYRLHRSQ